MDSLRNENFDLLYFDAVDLCSFLIAEKIGKPFVVFLSVLTLDSQAPCLMFQCLVLS